MTSWRARTATEGDLAAIMALERAVFPEDAWSEDAMRAELAHAGGRYAVAVGEADEVLGYAGLRVAGAQADIQTIAVAPSARRQGIGRALIVELLEEARGRGATEVFLEVRADNASARALYESLGFREIGVRPRYYSGRVDAVVMRLPLAPQGTFATRRAD